ncbi:hypothetical protein SAY86_006712 [Trapa natans]|uniref:Uncharacterized protein n=1 Tax=Trapa natans TaxID=22666 RepID=A0AAN7L750_TRANT|nr:hypothetical protein SAY86_006712 [Trapa natans]
MLQKELFSLQSLWDRKSELVGHRESLPLQEELCVEEGKREENTVMILLVFDSSVLQISKIDACMIETITALQQLECKMDAVTILDYRWILVQLIKLYMKVGIEPADLLCPVGSKTRIEDLAEKDAIKKSDAAREAFLAELALDSSKCGTNNLKHGNDKAKDKKRHKGHRKTNRI